MATLTSAEPQNTKVTLEKITSSLFTKLYKSFLHDDDPLSDEQDWRNVFDYQWDTEEDYCGYAMLAGDELVGMLGMVFSKRYINGTIKKFCNLHTWWVREDHRGRSLTLLRPILKLDGYTITHFTPCDTIRAITKRMGFKPLSAQLTILLPHGIFRNRYALDESALEHDEQVIEERLNEHDRRILLDHRPYGCGHLLVSDGDDYCYLLYTHVVRHRMPYCHVHYISDKDVFAKKEGVVRSWLLRNHQAKFVAIDTRLISDMALPRSFNFWAPSHGLYKSSDVAPEQIDNLYSDVVFLKLTCLPDMSHELRQIARRMWPLSKK